MEFSADAQRNTTRAEYSVVLRVIASTTRTPVTLFLPSSNTSECTTASGWSVRLPVAAAAGRVTPFDEKYALYGQPRAHWLRPWQGPRPLCSRESTAVALQMSLRSPPNAAAM